MLGPNSAEMQLALDIAKMFNLPDNLIWYKLKFSATDSPTLRCEYEVWIDDVPNIVDGKIERIKGKYKVHVEEVE